MGFYHSDLINTDHYVLCKAALIFGVTRWIFFWAHKLVKHYMFIFSFLSFEDEFPSQTSISPSFSSSSPSLAIARENLRLTSFGDLSEERENCHDHHDRSCAVCLMNFNKEDQVWKLSNCSHVFHRQCLDRWLRYDSRMTCPLCRSSLINPAAPEPPSQQQQQPGWAVERILYLFGDDLLHSS